MVRDRPWIPDPKTIRRHTASSRRNRTHTPSARDRRGKIMVATPQRVAQKTFMRYFSAFSGIGGFELGIKQAHESISNQAGGEQSKEERKHERDNVHPQGERTPICIGYSEIDKYAIQIYQKHFPQHKNYGDATKINTRELPDFDFFVGGFPCQAFSIAGLRRGFDDTRGTLFFDIARILHEKQPRLFLLENVKGLLSHDDGGTFKTIIATLTELGYDLQWQVLNSKDFGVPQNRERVFIIGNFRGTAQPKVFPIVPSNPKGLIEITTGADEASRVYDTAGIARTIKNGGGMGAKTGLYIPTIRATEYKGGDNQTIIVEDFYPDRARIFEGSPTLRSGREGLKVMQQTKIRRLTPMECERLQGFPDGWTEGVSDTQRYKTLGNAVTVNVVREIAKKIKP